MAEPLSAIASVASIAGLADVSCRLAGSLYKSFQAVKEAPRNIKRLSKSLAQLHSLLQQVDNLVKRYSDSPSVVENGLSIATVQSLLQDCKTELDEVEEATAPFRKHSCSWKDAAKRIKWVVEMREIDRHCQAVDEFGRRIGVALSVVGRQHDITASETQKALQSQVTGVRDILQASLTETKDQVSAGLSTVQTGIEQAASTMTKGHDKTRSNLRLSHNRLRRDVLQTGRRNRRGLEIIRDEVRDVSSFTRSAQRQSSQHQRILNRSISRVESVLSELSSLRPEPQGKRSTSALAQHSRLDSMMLSLMLMRSSIYRAVSQSKSIFPAKVSRDAETFLLDEFENLVAFGHEASALRNRQSFEAVDEDNERLQLFAAHTSTLRDYSLDVDKFSITSVTPKQQWRTLSHIDNLGHLEVGFQENVGDHNGMPTSMVKASFHFIPNLDVHSTGVFAMFQKKMQMACKPCISRTLREIRQIVDEDDRVGRPLITALRDDDLPTIQRMLSSGQIRPWDQNDIGQNLLSMAAWYGGSGNILDYLLQTLGDFVDFSELQRWIWAGFIYERNYPSRRCMKRDLQSYFNISRRAIDLEQPLDEDLIFEFILNDIAIVELPNNLDWQECLEICEFLVGHRANAECKDRRGETALLKSARSTSNCSSVWTRGFLQCGANSFAVDDKGRGLLHLSLRYSRGSHPNLFPGCSISWVEIRAKLVELLKAGCQIRAVDNRGRTPTDFARGLNLKNVWVSALKEVDLLDDDILELVFNGQGCSVIDSDSESCASWNFSEEDEEDDEEEDGTDSDDDEVNNEYKVDADDDANEDDSGQKDDGENNKNEEYDEHELNVNINPPQTKNHPTNKDILTIETPLSIPEQEKDNPHQAASPLTAPHPHSVPETHTSPPPPPTANPELEADSVIALGRHHIWI